MYKTKTATDVWHECLQILKDNLPPESFNQWFKPLIPVKLENDKITLQVPSPYFPEYIEAHYLDILSKVLKRVIGPKAKLEYRVVAVQSANKKRSNRGVYTVLGNITPPPQNKPVNAPIAGADIKNPVIAPGLKRIRIESNLKPDFNFDNFIEGDCNRFARKIGYDIAQNPGKRSSYNPLMIFGPTGNGKTHLVHAIGLKIKELFPQKTVVYMRADEFETEFSKATIENQKIRFVEEFKFIDVLIIDDIHELASKTKEKTQTEFFHVFNELYNRNSQLIITSDRPPVEIDNMNERLISRFKWGITVQLKAPDYETRIKVLKHKAYQEGINVPDRVIRFIAENVTSSIRELEGALYSLIAHATYEKTSITIDLAKRVLKNLIKEKKRTISLDYIKQTVTKHFGIDEKVLLSRSRTKEVVLARQIIMYLARKYTDLSLTTIGQELRRDHSTVLHAYTTINDQIKNNHIIRQHVQEIINMINY